MVWRETQRGCLASEEDCVCKPYSLDLIIVKCCNALSKHNDFAFNAESNLTVVKEIITEILIGKGMLITTWG